MSGARVARNGLPSSRLFAYNCRHHHGQGLASQAPLSRHVFLGAYIYIECLTAQVLDWGCGRPAVGRQALDNTIRRRAEISPETASVHTISGNMRRWARGTGAAGALMCFPFQSSTRANERRDAGAQLSGRRGQRRREAGLMISVGVGVACRVSRALDSRPLTPRP